MILTPQQVAAMPIQKVVDDPEWQVVRKSLIGNWVRNHIANVNRLYAYLDQQQWSPLAVRRVLNVLTGTVHRVGHTAGQTETDRLRAKVRIRWAEMLGRSYDHNDPRYAMGVIGAGVNEGFPE